MTREEQIREASIDYQLSTNPRAIGGDAFAEFAREMNVNPSFIAGAKWAEKMMIEKACEWLKKNCTYIHPRTGKKACVVNLNAFKKAMENNSDRTRKTNKKNKRPVLLTEEFFERNGIKKVDYDYFKPNVLFESKDQRIRITDITNSGDGYWCVDVHNEDYETIGSCDVKYVHQFQQLLRLCGYEMDVVV